MSVGPFEHDDFTPNERSLGTGVIVRTDELLELAFGTDIYDFPRLTVARIGRGVVAPIAYVAVEGAEVARLTKEKAQEVGKRLVERWTQPRS